MASKKQKRHRLKQKLSTPIKWGIIGLSILLLSMIVFLIGRSMLKSDPGINFALSFHGSIRGDSEYPENYRAKNMRDAVQVKLMRNGLYIDSYEVCWIEGIAVGTQGDTYYLEDQLLMLSFFAEHKDRRKFKLLNARIQQTFESSSGYYVTSITLPETQSEDISDQIPVSLSLQLRYTRALIEGYTQFKDPNDLQKAKDLSALILPHYQARGSIPPPETQIYTVTPAPIPDFSATPTPKPEDSSSSGNISLPDSESDSVLVLNLASVDLYAMRLLSYIDARWTDVYDNSLSILKNAVIGEPIPLFFAAYDPTSRGYLPFTGNAPLFVTSDQMKTLLSLTEVGEMPLETYEYLRQILLNTRALYQSYHITSGNPAQQTESIASYAYMARIARINKDKNTYEFCMDRIFWNTATSTTSKIYSLPFTQTEDDRVNARTLDAVLCLKGLY
jgi:hypothetical protein